MNDLIVRKIETARQLLAEAKDAKDAKKIVDIAHAAKVYAMRQKLSQESIDYAHAIKVDALALLGDFLKGMEKNVGTKGQLSGPGVIGGSVKEPPINTPPTLASIGVTKKESMIAQKLAALAESQEDVFESVRENKTTLKAAVCKAKQAERAPAEKIANARACKNLETLILAKEKFGTIYADPPWKYSNQATRAATDNHYCTMTVDELCALPIRELAADKCHLHLWTTNAFLFDCPRIFEAWGFEYKSIFVWCKESFGIGNYWRVSHELMLTATKGGETFRNKSLKSWAVLPRGEHSVKPAETRRMIETASPGPYLELFGRRPADNWTVWGNELFKDMYDHDLEHL